MSETLLVLTTMPDQAAAEQLAGRLIEERLCACVNIGGPVTSLYHWRGAVQRDQEFTLTIKTTRLRYPALEAALVAAHPYELPEVIAVPITDGLSDYLSWIDTCTNS